MHVERVVVTPRKEVYNPGDVIYLSIFFGSPFNGQVAVGLVPRDHRAGDDFRATTFAKSSPTLYEGQIYIWESDVGVCRLMARLVPVKGDAETIAVGDEIFNVRPLVPSRR
jgi:hypothetical protein